MLSVSWLLIGAGTAFADISVTIHSPAQGGIAGEPLAISATVSSTFEVTSVHAVVDTRTVALVPTGGRWEAVLSLDGLPRGSYQLVVTATNSGGQAAQATRQFTYDRLPVLTVTAPGENTLAQPDVRITAVCSDDGPTCRIRVLSSSEPGTYLGATNLALANNHIDTSVRPPDEARSLIIEASDSTGRSTAITRSVFVITSRNLHPATTLTGGEIIALDATRALMLDKTVSPFVLRLVHRTLGTSQIIWTGTSADDEVRKAYLTPTGAIFSTIKPAQIFHPILEWRSGVLVDLGTGSAWTLVAKGGWALWTGMAPPCCTNPQTLILRDLTTGTNTTITAAAGNINNDVAATGYVAFWAGSPRVPPQPPAAPFEIHEYVPGPPPRTTQLTTAAPLWSVYPKTDGANVVFRRVASGAISEPNSIILRTQAGIEVVLATDMFSLSDTAYQIANGWVAFQRRGTASSIQVWRRAPDGTQQQISSTGGTAEIEALNENGDLVYTEFPPDGTHTPLRYLARPGQPRLDLGKPFGTLVSVDGTWCITAAQHVLTIEKVPARSILSEGATGSFFTTDVAVLNPNTIVVPVSINYLREGGSVIHETRELAPRSRITIHENQISGLEATGVATVVDALDGSPLVVERLMSWDGDGYGGHLGSSVDRPRPRWLFAEGAQGFFDTFFLLANSETTDATVRFTYLVEQGAPVTRTVTVPAGARVTVYAGGVTELINSSFGTVIDSNVPIVAERAMYFGSSPFWLAGHGTAGVPEPSATWFHAEGATGSFFDTYILLANPHALDVLVSLTFVADTNQTYTRTKTIPALSRLTINVEHEVPELASAAVSTFVSSLQFPIISERAMYWGPPALGWRESHDSVGMTSPGVRWGLAEGRAGGARGYQTFVLVSNNTAEVATLMATFVREDGQIIERTYTVSAHQRLTIEASAISELANSNFGTIIESSDGVPINVESAIYWSASGVHWEGGVNTTATRLP